ncbi:hypothetical protein BC826DRAFT_649331 [Russula brevipes]|nr:hypothetical protein BC826DRAFT_649331 [Russula brevipes]
MPQRQSSGQDGDPLPTSGATAVKLNSDVLLEIFDFFRRIINYEKYWNDTDGWFKLAHVCREWRALVFAHPSRLRLRLRFSGHRTRQAIASTGIPPLPIVVDYSSGIGSQKIYDCMVSALADANHVCSIAAPTDETLMKTLLMAINSPFPALESLELSYWSTLDFDFPPIFRTHPPPLRRLRFHGVACPFLYKVLSLSTTLVDVTLLLDSVVIEELKIPLIFYLQDLPSLCYLTVALYSTTCPPQTALAPPDQMGDIVLSRLRYLSFKGNVPRLEFLVARLQLRPCSGFTSPLTATIFH